MREPIVVDTNLLREFPLPHHPSDADKEDRGLAFVIAGSPELPGAAVLAGLGALRSGAGKLRMATCETVALALGIAIPEASVIAFREDQEGCIHPEAIAPLVGRCGDAASLTLGPGMQKGVGLTSFIEALLAGGGDFPLVLDAAALGVLKPLSHYLRSWTGGSILLPHAGEMAQLLDRDRDSIQNDPLPAVRAAAAMYGSIALIKGEWSFIATPDGRSFRFHGGGVGLATSGSGDTLAGIVGGLAARGADALASVLWGVYLHGEAGRLLSRQVGRIGFLAREILNHVPRLMET